MFVQIQVPQAVRESDFPGQCCVQAGTLSCDQKCDMIVRSLRSPLTHDLVGSRPLARPGEVTQATKVHIVRMNIVGLEAIREEEETMRRQFWYPLYVVDDFPW